MPWVIGYTVIVYTVIVSDTVTHIDYIRHLLMSDRGTFQGVLSFDP